MPIRFFLHILQRSAEYARIREMCKHTAILKCFTLLCETTPFRLFPHTLRFSATPALAHFPPSLQYPKLNPYSGSPTPRPSPSGQTPANSTHTIGSTAALRATRLRTLNTEDSTTFLNLIVQWKYCGLPRWTPVFKSSCTPPLCVAITYQCDYFLFPWIKFCSTTTVENQN